MSATRACSECGHELMMEGLLKGVCPVCEGVRYRIIGRDGKVRTIEDGNEDKSTTVSVSASASVSVSGDEDNFGEQEVRGVDSSGSNQRKRDGRRKSRSRREEPRISRARYEELVEGLRRWANGS